MRDIVGVEPEFAVTVVEKRGLTEGSNIIRIKFVTRAVSMVISPFDITFRMGESHGANSESAETKLITSNQTFWRMIPADKTSVGVIDRKLCVSHTKLSWDDHDGVWNPYLILNTPLLTFNQPQPRKGPFMLTQVTWGDLTPAAVVERP